MIDYRALSIGGAVWIGALSQSWFAAYRGAAVAGILVLLALASKKGRFIVLASALLLGSTIMSLRQQSLATSAIAEYFGQSIEVTAQIVTDPAKTTPKVVGVAFTPTSYSFLARALIIRQGEREFHLQIPVRIISSNKGVRALLPGQKIRGTARIVKSKESRVAALVLMNSTVEIVTPASQWARSLSAIRLGLRNHSGSGDGGALIPGMVLGDTSKQTPEFKNAMKRSGLTHLVAVSGANFAIVSGFVLFCMQFIFRKMSYRLSATAISLICFIALVRPSPSVLRAAAMAAVLLLAKGTHRGRDALPALGFAMAAVVIGDPWQGRDPGFALSVLATAGLLLFAPKVAAWFSRFMPEVIAEALAIPIAAMIFCAPVIVAISGYVSFMSVVANILAAPAVAPITILGFIAALISPFAPWISSALIFLIKPLAAWIALVAHWAGNFSVISLGTGLRGFLIVMAIIVFILTARLFLKPYFTKLLIISVLLAIALTWLQRFPVGDWQIANCDVGQGDALVLNLGAHRAILIDTGPDPALVDRCLSSLGINEISLLVLTHTHADHVGGLSGAIRKRKVLAQWQGSLRAGTVAHIQSDRGPVKLQVLWPDGATHAFGNSTGSGSEINNTSIALLISAADFTLFTGGDIEPPVQSLITPAVHRVDIYKVSHHGSAYQDLDFMKALSPQLAVISVGTGNSYGHPAPKTMTALSRLGAKVLRTDLDGAIAIKVRNHQLTVSMSKHGFRLWQLG